METYPMTAFWFDRAKRCIGWETTDQAQITGLCQCLESDLVPVVTTLSGHLATFKGTQPLMSNARFVQRLHGVLHEWLTGLLDGSFDGGYVQARQDLVQKLTQLDLTYEDMILLDSLTRRELSALIKTKLNENPDAQSATMAALDKAMCLDLALIYNSYARVREAEIERTLLDRFLAVTGFSRTLYDNLAEAQNRKAAQRQTKTP